MGVLAQRFGNCNMILWGEGGMLVMAVLMTVGFLVDVPALSIVFTGLYVIAFNVTLGPLVRVITDDLFPDSVRATATSIGIGANWLCNLIVGVSYTYIADGLDDYSYLPFVVLLAIFYLLSLKLVPETSNKSAEEVQSLFLLVPSTDDVWQTLWQPWSQAFIAKLDWRLLLFPKPRDLKAVWRWQQKQVLLLCRVHTAIAFHSIWRLRNDIYFHETDADKPSTQSVKASFGRHCQFIFRHSAELGFEKRTVCVIPRRLGLEEPVINLFPRHQVGFGFPVNN
ncbi:hypothetical protein PHPALM_30019 [Phytophthora palmivora]|uniref:Major facilitator superfamily (MFS) profile domain-containing protein n=1 Tax=Phytophthora palmivora TaxID=4796 RepID=A0A2P4X652_9STRA|nr:hypothetical protein PHPALM_30019 [Phytophthora palmivora]